MVDDNCGIRVEVSGCTESQIVDELSKAILSLARKPEHRVALSEGALGKAYAMCWASNVRSVYANLAGQIKLYEFNDRGPDAN